MHEMLDYNFLGSYTIPGCVIICGRQVYVITGIACGHPLRNPPLFVKRR